MDFNFVTIPAMPTVLLSGPYRFYFYSHEPNEPPHVHVDRDSATAKFWLFPVALVFQYGFPKHEVSALKSIVKEYQTVFIEAWHGHFGTGS
jgi:hypothetical protein